MPSKAPLRSKSLAPFAALLLSLFGGGAAAPKEDVFEFGKDGPAITEWLVAQPYPDGPAADNDPSKPSSPMYDEDYLRSLGGEAKARPRERDRVVVPGLKLTPPSRRSPTLPAS